MAKAKFTCPRCSRKFSMKAHLARHMSTIHSRGGAKTAKTGKKRGRPKGSRTRTPSRAMAGWDSGSAQIIEQMQSYHGALLARQSALENEINAVSRAIDAIGGATAARPSALPVKRGPGRPKGSGGRSGSLKDYILKVLSQAAQPLSPREIGDRVMKSGYPTKAHDLTKAVSNTLPDVKQAKRVSFGQYTYSG